MLVMGFDPGLRNAGWAVWSTLHRAVTNCGLIKTPGVIDRRKVRGEYALEVMCALLKECLSFECIGLLVIEAQDFHGRKSKDGSKKAINPIDISRIATVGGMFSIQQPAKVTRFITPAEWTGGFNKKINQNRILKRAGLTREEVAEMADCTVAQAKEPIDAIGLAMYGAKELLK